jgi:Flp pilus assembly protein TadB
VPDVFVLAMGTGVVVIVVAVAVVLIVLVVALSLRGRDLRRDKRVADDRERRKIDEPPSSD